MAIYNYCDWRFDGTYFNPLSSNQWYFFIYLYQHVKWRLWTRKMSLIIKKYCNLCRIKFNTYKFELAWYKAVPLGTRRCCDVESKSLMLIQRRNNVVCSVGWVAVVRLQFKWVKNYFRTCYSSANISHDEHCWQCSVVYLFDLLQTPLNCLFASVNIRSPWIMLIQ